MSYNQFVNDFFIEHHSCMGLDDQEINLLLEESTQKQREKWLVKNGYDLSTEWDLWGKEAYNN